MIYTLLTVYLLSAFGSWWYTSKAHFHPKGNYYDTTDPNSFDIFWILTPVCNTFVFFFYTVIWKDQKYRKTKLWKTKW